MKPLTKAIVVTTIQGLIVCLLGAKLLYDRRTRPQAWFFAQRYDPNLPIRGRYLALQLEVEDPRSTEEVQKKFDNELRLYRNQNYTSFGFGQECGSVGLRDGSPVAQFYNHSPYSCDNVVFQRWRDNTRTVLRVSQPVLFFISDRAKDPSFLDPGEELWVLATIPRTGPPRPIALGIKKDGERNIRQLNLN